MKLEKWILCPVCGSKTHNRMRDDTVLLNFPLYCPKCKQETLVAVQRTENNSHQRAVRIDAEPMNL